MTLAVLLYGVPVTACLMPAEMLTAPERECCKQMAGECGSRGIPNSQPCCWRLAGPDYSSFFAPDSQHDLGDLVVVATGGVLASAHTLIADSTAHVRWLEGVHGPPESPPITVFVLRI